MTETDNPEVVFNTDSRFFARFVLLLAALIVFAFGLHAVLGRAAYTAGLVWPHVHAGLMLAWLAACVTQARLAANGNLALHRRLGWATAYLTVGVVASMSYAGIAAVRSGLVPPFFTPPFLLALTQVGAVVFGGLVFAAIARRSQTDYHRRLMAGSLVLLADPALGRLLPMPLLGNAGEWATMAIQLAIIGVIALHDRRVIGRIHQATATSGAIIAMGHVLVALSGNSPFVIDLADRLAGG